MTGLIVRSKPLLGKTRSWPVKSLACFSSSLLKNSFSTELVCKKPNEFEAQGFTTRLFQQAARRKIDIIRQQR
jgi:hypothetical protein